MKPDRRSVVLGALWATLAAPVLAASTNPSAANRPRIINHTLRVTDMDRSLRFYREALGMHEKRRRMQGAALDVAIGYSEDATVSEIMLIASPDFPGPFPAEAASQVILETTDIDGLTSRVLALGGKVVRPPSPVAASGAQVRVAVVEDYDGHRFEIVQFL